VQYPLLVATLLAKLSQAKPYSTYSSNRVITVKRRTTAQQHQATEEVEEEKKNDDTTTVTPDPLGDGDGSSVNSNVPATEDEREQTTTTTAVAVALQEAVAVEPAPHYANRHVAAFLPLQQQQQSGRADKADGDGDELQVITNGSLLSLESIQQGRLSLQYPILIQDSPKSIGMKVPSYMTYFKCIVLSPRIYTYGSGKRNVKAADTSFSHSRQIAHKVRMRDKSNKNAPRRGIEPRICLRPIRHITVFQL
jgi:hypothetical protein